MYKDDEWSWYHRDRVPFSQPLLKIFPSNAWFGVHLRTYLSQNKGIKMWLICVHCMAHAFVWVWSCIFYQGVKTSFSLRLYLFLLVIYCYCIWNMYVHYGQCFVLYFVCFAIPFSPNEPCAPLDLLCLHVWLVNLQVKSETWVFRSIYLT